MLSLKINKKHANTPELAKFAESIVKKCAVPAAGFYKKGIAKHIQDFFNEQRRYKKGKLVGDKYMLFSSIPRITLFLYLSINPPQREILGPVIKCFIKKIIIHVKL